MTESNVWWKGFIISIISNNNFIIFKKEITDVNVKKEWSYYKTLSYTEKNLSKLIFVLYFRPFKYELIK